MYAHAEMNGIGVQVNMGVATTTTPIHHQARITRNSCVVGQSAKEKGMSAQKAIATSVSEALLSSGNANTRSSGWRDHRRLQRSRREQPESSPGITWRAE